MSTLDWVGVVVAVVMLGTAGVAVAYALRDAARKWRQR